MGSHCRATPWPTSHPELNSTMTQTPSLDFNVEEYSPEDLHIKTEADVLIISAKKENKTPAGKSYVARQFEQRFTLPSGVNPEKISSKLGTDGVLRVFAP